MSRKSYGEILPREVTYSILGLMLAACILAPIVINLLIHDHHVSLSPILNIKKYNLKIGLS